MTMMMKRLEIERLEDTDLRSIACKIMFSLEWEGERGDGAAIDGIMLYYVRWMMDDR
jgi:hypothetical protein